jgi:hypothetical protein
MNDWSVTVCLLFITACFSTVQKSLWTFINVWICRLRLLLEDLSWRGGLRAPVTQTAMLTGTYAPGRATRARRGKG